MKKNFIITTLFSCCVLNCFAINEIVDGQQNTTQELHVNENPLEEIKSNDEEKSVTENNVNDANSDLKNDELQNSEEKTETTLNEEKEKFEFKKNNLFTTLWSDFENEKSDLLHKCNDNNNLAFYTIQSSYEKFDALDKFVSDTISNTLKSMQESDRNKVLGIEKMPKNTSKENWNKRVNSAFRKFTETLDNELFSVHFDQNDATSFNRSITDNIVTIKTCYTLKRVSPSKKFQFYAESKYNTSTNTCSTPIVQLRCVLEKKIQLNKKYVRHITK